MNPRHWQKVKALLDEALERDTGERSEYLSHACGGDTALLAEVERLLRLEDEAEAFIETPIVDLRPGNGQPAGPRPLIDRYRVIDEIGRGGMGAVYLAERADQEFEQRVAVKVLKRGLDTDEIVGRFRAERQILAGLEHPNVARLIDGGTTGDGLPYFVLEYVEGRPIDRYCDEEGLGLEERLKLLRTVCEAVAYAHRNLVIHRDLKPGNILVTADGTPKLLDFGIAKLLSPEPSEAFATRVGFQFLTPEYAAPEQISGEGVDTTTDVYLLGLLLYRLVAGELPFDRDDRSPERLEKHPPAPSTKTRPEWRKRVAGDLDRIVAKALHPERGRRYGSAEQLSEDLRRFLKGMPVQATPDSFWYRAGKFTRRHRAGVAAAAVFVLVVLAFGLTSNALMRQAQREKDVTNRVVEFFLDTLAEADPGANPGKDITVVEALDQGVKKFAQSPNLPPDIRAEFADLMGRVYLRLGKFKAAEPLFAEVLAFREAEHGASHPEVLRAVSDLANVYFELGDPRAESYLNRTIETYERSAPNSPDHLRALLNLALLMRQQNRAEEGKAILEELLPIQLSLYGNSNRSDVAQTLHNLGLMHSDLSEYDQAALRFREALTLRRQLGDAEDVANSLNSLATALENGGDLEAAIPLYEESLAIQQEFYTRDHPRMVGPLNNLGMAHFRQGHLEEADRLIREALNIVTPRSRPRLLRNLAAVEAARGQTTTAEETIRQALDLLHDDDATGSADSKADAESVLGGILEKQGRFAEAGPLLVNGYSVLASLNGPDDRYTREALDRLIDFYATTGQSDLAERYRLIRNGELPPSDTFPTATPFEIDLM